MNESLVYSALGESVATRRNALGLTQADIATKVGISRASIANIEAGRQKVLLHQVYLLAAALKLQSITDLVGQSATIVSTALHVPVSRDDLSEKQKAQVHDALFGVLSQREPVDTQRVKV
ncbi:MAG: transcriptional regulator [Alphaproteobacteria bacterium PA3]|nr:MAG: transcriptional regulator [Alphaproteobacteria bacterium PA3]